MYPNPFKHSHVRVRMRRIQGKRGISPIIGAVILIGLATAIGAFVFTWGAELIPRQVLLSGDPVELLCPQLELEVGVFGDELDIYNKGNIPLHGGTLKVNTLGTTTTHSFVAELGPGKSTAIPLADIGVTLVEGQTIIFSPSLLGETSQGEQVVYECSRNIPVEIF